MIETSPLFIPWKDPHSGVVSYLLDRRVAPLQQSFYFTSECLSRDGRYLWFYCAFPPGGDAYYGRQLAVADLKEGQVSHYPETQFADASPYMDPATGDIYWTTLLGLWKRAPGADQPVIPVNTFPESLAHNRRPLRIATHLFRCADGKSFAIDAQIGRDWFLGDMPLDGSPFRLWKRFERGYNHAQFSPVDPDLILIAQDGWYDPVTGEKGEAVDRIWLARRDGRVESLFPDSPSNARGHEWWGSDGRHVWYVHYGRGVASCRLADRKVEMVWPLEFASHAHADTTDRYLVADAIPNDHPESRVAFFNRESGRSIDIVSHLPYPAPDLRLYKSKYHVHPHPRFSGDDRYIIYTTTVRGIVDVAVVPVAPLVGMTSNP